MEPLEKSGVVLAGRPAFISFTVEVKPKDKQIDDCHNCMERRSSIGVVDNVWRVGNHVEHMLLYERGER